MATQDKVMLLHQVEGTLKPRMFANLLEEAVAEITDHLNGYDIQHISGTGGTADDMLKTFIDAKRVEGRSESTLIRYQYIIERFMNFAKCNTSEVTTHHVRAYIAAEQERGVADSTLDGMRQVLSSFFGWLDHERMIPSNPMGNIAAIKAQKKVREAFSAYEIQRLKKSCTNTRDMAIMCFLLCSGCRISEVCGLNRDDINFSDGECVVLGKGNKQRTAFMDSVGIMTLKEYLASRKDDNEALFVGKRGERLQPGGVRAMLKVLAKAAGVENVHPHRFRRTIITTLLNRGMPIQEVAIIAGHEKVDTTMRYYAVDKSRIKSSYHRYSV